MKILFLAGSSRKDSLNKKLARAAYTMAKNAGADATFVDLAEFPMPIYNGDLEESMGLPEEALEFKKMVTAHTGLFIASPEYNGSFSALLKNTIDWISRKHEEDEPALSAFQGKVVALAAASPGGLGGLRGLVPLRMLMGNIGTLVLPQQMALGWAGDAFNEEGALVKDPDIAMLQGLIDSLIAEVKSKG